eukprot:TRINITY_DN60222_c0_g1_i1.p1 TRINITY_DN60222_c0_g1~~TRINITY_DN60222_c0_g1_i1.p1  ORF type:complete len:321 (+),score=69.29 TRINITY_DN60222_c0_g1_i1:432-1394(+)
MQLVNYVRGTHNLTRKNLLVQTLRRHAAGHQEADISWLPETFQLDQPGELEQVKERLNREADSLYIVKPVGRNKGNGIQVHSRQELKLLMEADRVPHDFIVQHYIPNPLLLDGFKFDMRMYILLATVKPFVAYWFPRGYLRLSLVKYSSALTSNRQAHLTNVAVQRQDANFKEKAEDSIWSFAQLQAYLTEKKLADPGFVDGALRDQMRQCCRTLVQAVSPSCDKKIGCFQLMGVDLLLCTEMKLHLLEVNRNPDLSVHTKVLGRVIPPVLEEIVEIVMEVHAKQMEGQPLFPIRAASKAELLWSADNTDAPSTTPQGIS